ncbi:MAG: hypothetical protein JXL67_13360, partial [Calditrichaeota bacterium]|nr:hypothetical protein [Calditrichota bacterium]
RLEEFMNIFSLQDKGFSISAIHRETGMDRKTIRKYLKLGRHQRPVMKKWIFFALIKNLGR